MAVSERLFLFDQVNKIKSLFFRFNHKKYYFRTLFFVCP